MSAELVAEIRRAFADYVVSEGCDCCRNKAAHEEAAQRLAKLLRVPRYKDGSGYDFYRYETKRAGNREEG